MTPEQENQWREEFRIFFFKGSEFWHNSNTAISIEKYSEPYKHGVQGYIEARKKAQEELKERDELIKEAMPYIEYLSKGRLYSNHLVDVWIEKAKKLAGEK